MPSVCLYFQVHQPLRVKRYRVFDIGRERNYFNDGSEGNLNNKKIVEKVASKCYLPTNELLMRLLTRFPGFKVSFSFSGVLLDQLEEYSPQTLRSFQKLVGTGNPPSPKTSAFAPAALRLRRASKASADTSESSKRVEVLAETYYHSLAFLYSQGEFARQVKAHKKRIKELFGLSPAVFRNTELIYNNDLAREAERMGYSAILSEGADHILQWRSPNFVYTPKGTSRINLLLKNHTLSDDIAFRFSSKDWQEYPLTARKFADWISTINGSGEVVNLFMDYETFGEHQWADTGIFDFLEALPTEILKHPDNNFVIPSEAAARYRPVAELDVPHFISWADVERDLSAWLSNSMQKDALEHLYAMEKAILKSKNSELTKDWRKLQTSDHFYYMCTKWFADGDVHKYFNPYNSPYDAFISFMNVLQDMRLRAAVNAKR